MTQGFRFDVRCYWCAGPTELVNPGAHASTEAKAVVRYTACSRDHLVSVLLRPLGNQFDKTTHTYGDLDEITAAATRRRTRRKAAA